MQAEAGWCGRPVRLLAEKNRTARSEFAIRIAIPTDREFGRLSSALVHCENEHSMMLGKGFGHLTTVYSELEKAQNTIYSKFLDIFQMFVINVSFLRRSMRIATLRISSDTERPTRLCPMSGDSSPNR